jgi:ATP-dependent RNA helicase DDX55/SPB4
MKKDKDLIEKAQHAFVSFIRYYKEHELKFIFNFKSLDIGSIANSFTLLRLPRIKEILGKKVIGFTNQFVDLDAIGYKSKSLLIILCI